MKIKIKELARSIKDRLQDSKYSGNNYLTFWIISEVTGMEVAKLFTIDDLELTSDQQNRLQYILSELMDKNKPLQYIFGSIDFLNLKIKVTPPILIPRPETEAWCQEVINTFSGFKDQALNILDLCCGTGCIGLSFAKNFPKSNVLLLDINPDAIALAKENAQLNKIENVKFLQSDLFEKVPQNLKFDLIVSNPPYISAKDYETLSPEVKDWEDKMALFAEDEGLALIKKIIKESPIYLDSTRIEKNNRDQFNLFIEIGYDQKLKIKNFLQEIKFRDMKFIKDLQGHDRVIALKI